MASARYVRNGAKFTRYLLYQCTCPGAGISDQKQPAFFSFWFTVTELLSGKRIYEENRFTLTGICPGRSGFKVIKENKPEHFLFPEEPELQGVHFVGEGYRNHRGWNCYRNF